MGSDDIFSQIKTVIIYSFPVVSFFGTLGNLVSFIIFSRKKFKNTTFWTYYRFLCITDTFGLFICVCNFIYNIFGINLRIFNEFSCKFIVLIAYAMPTTGGWTLVVISLDRLVNIVWPNRLNLIKKTYFQILVCIGILIANIAVYFQTLLSHIITVFEYYEYLDYPTSNDTSLNSTYLCSVSWYLQGPLLVWLDLFNSAVFPFTFMVIFTTINIIVLYRYKRLITRSNNSIPREQSTSVTRFAATSIALNVLYLVLNIPLVLYYLLSRYQVEIITGPGSVLVPKISIWLFYVNSATVFYTNLCVNTIFRKELWLFCRDIGSIFSNIKRNITNSSFFSLY
jgi:hypothetical protein